MPLLNIKGLCIGSGRPKTVVPLMGATCNDVLEGARRAVEAGADCIEWRADFLDESHDPHALSDACQALGNALPHTPLLATLRTTTQGGNLAADADEYAALLSAVITSGGADMVDVEITIIGRSSRELVQYAHRQGVYAIASCHDCDRTPPAGWMQRQLLALADSGADICKLAVMARDFDDASRLMQASFQATTMLNKPIATMAMGEAGTITRLMGESFGSALTFCSLDAPSAPGQVELSRTIAALDALHAALK